MPTEAGLKNWWLRIVGKIRFGLFIYLFSRILRLHNLKKILGDLKVMSQNNQVI